MSYDSYSYMNKDLTIKYDYPSDTTLITERIFANVLFCQIHTLNWKFFFHTHLLDLNGNNSWQQYWYKLLNCKLELYTYLI